MQGEAVVTITIPLEIYADIVFSYKKVCNKEPVQGFMVGTEPGDDNVVSDGLPWVYFDSRPEAEGKRMVVDKDTHSTTFFVWLKPLHEGKEDVIDFQAPVVTAS